MRVVFPTKEAYAEFEKRAKAKGQSTRELAVEILQNYLLKSIE